MPTVLRVGRFRFWQHLAGQENRPLVVRRQHRREQHKHRARDKQTAAARLKQLQAELDQGVMPGRPYRVGEYAQRWMEKVVINLKPKTQRFYRQTTEHYLLPYLGERTLVKRIGAEAILDMLNRMRRAGYAEQTIDHAYTVGKRCSARL